MLQGSQVISTEADVAPATSCLTFIAIRQFNNKMLREIRFHEPDTANQSFKAISCSEADVEVVIHQSQPDSRLVIRSSAELTYLLNE